MSKTRKITDSQGRLWRVSFVLSRGGAEGGLPIQVGQDAPIHEIEFSAHGGPTFRMAVRRGELDAMSDADLLTVIEREATRRDR